MLNLSRLLDRRREHWMLATMLIVLNLALRADFGSTLSASLMTAHIGLFFLWQPIWQRDQRLTNWSIVLIVLSISALFTALDWQLLFAWTILLIGIVAGRSFSTREERIVYMVALAILISMLLLECVPKIFAVGKPNSTVLYSFRLSWLLLPLALLFFPTSQAGQRESFPIDFFRGVTIALITALLAAGSVLLTYELKFEYLSALIASLLAVGAFLVLTSWLIAPSSGAGLGALWEKSVLNIGTPFESWLSSLARLAQQPLEMSQFLDASLDELCEMPWIAGAEWRAYRQSGSAGELGGHTTSLTTGDLTITLHTEQPVGPSLLIHCRLLIQVLGHFVSAKIRENEQAQQAHMQAVHETGARLTHDIKNLLQSLKTTTAATLQEISPDDSERAAQQQALLRRQLPHITQRLQLALDKLQQPSNETSPSTALSEWWEQLRARYNDQHIEFLADIETMDTAIPGESFDSIVENLLDNARNKAKTGHAIQIKVGLYEKNGKVVLSVADNGAAMPDALAKVVLKQPVRSDDGLGIGLYQSAQQAALNGYRLELSENEDGVVRFTLKRDKTH